MSPDKNLPYLFQLYNSADTPIYTMRQNML
jgi:hypothetical protein